MCCCFCWFLHVSNVCLVVLFSFVVSFVLFFFFFYLPSFFSFFFFLRGVITSSEIPWDDHWGETTKNQADVPRATGKGGFPICISSCHLGVSLMCRVTPILRAARAATASLCEVRAIASPFGADQYSLQLSHDEGSLSPFLLHGFRPCSLVPGISGLLISIQERASPFRGRGVLLVCVPEAKRRV